MVKANDFSFSLARCVLVILDGVGFKDTKEPEDKEKDDGTRFSPFLLHLFKTYHSTLLKASGRAVGLPDAQMGNSEVGHMTIGLGRIYLQSLVKLSTLFSSKQLWEEEPLHSVLKSKKKVIHLVGLLSPGGVHAHEDHLLEAASTLASSGFVVHIHAILDGRDTHFKSALTSLEKLNSLTKKNSSIHLSTMSGRYYAMDRDQRYDRTEKAYDAMALARGSTFVDSTKYILDAYEQGQTDEFIEPCVSVNYKGIQKGDHLWHLNFRADRVRQLLKKLCTTISGQTIATASYGEEFAHLPCVLKKEEIQNSLGEIIEKSQKKQIRIAETEKYAHVTFFFNGGREAPFKNEDRVLIPSPKIATYDLCPEMSADDVTKEVIKAIKKKYDLIVVNYANPDMVGHTGIQGAIKKAMQVIDQSLCTLFSYCESNGYHLFITSDHGNVDCMMHENGDPHTAHTTSLVPFIFIPSHDPEKEAQEKLKRQLCLSDTGCKTLSNIAPSVLKAMGIEIPLEMETPLF